MSTLSISVVLTCRPGNKCLLFHPQQQVTKDFLRLNLADELILSIMPIILGGGTLFFDHIGQEQRLHLKDLKAYKDGMVELWYEIKKEHLD